MAQSSWCDNSGREGRREWLASSSSGADDSESRWCNSAAAQWGQWWSGWEQSRRAGWWEDNPAWRERGVELPSDSVLENGCGNCGSWLPMPVGGGGAGGGSWCAEGFDAPERFDDESVDWSSEWSLADDRLDDVNQSNNAGNAPVRYWQHQNDVRLCVRPARSRCLY